jgi:hypothetical protein
MTELSQVRAETTQQPVVDASVVDATENLAKANKRAMDFLFGAQRLVFDELLFAANELLDRAKTETHLFSEFASRMAEAHSVKNIRTLWEECGRHQIEFMRRDSERLFNHGQRIIENMSTLFDGRRSD